MIFLVVTNILFAIALMFFWAYVDKKNNVIQINALSAFFLSGFFQISSTLLFLMVQHTSNTFLIDLFGKLYIFSTLTLPVVIFNYCVLFPRNTSLPMRIFSTCAIFLIGYSCFFQLETVSISASGAMQILSNKFFNLNVTAFAFILFMFRLILPLLGIVFFLVRAIFTKKKIFRFQMFLSAIVLVGTFVFSTLIVLGFSFDSSIIFLFPIVTLYIVFTLYLVTSVDNVASIKQIAISIKDFFMHYVLFGIIASLIIAFTFFYLPPNFSFVGILGILLLFLFHVFFRQKRKILDDHNRSDYSFALEDFFSKINYNADSADIMESVGNAFVQHLNASSIEFFVSSTDFELTIAVSTRNFTDEIIDTKNPLFDTLFDLGIFILSRPQISTIKKLSDVRQDLNTLFTNCDSETMIFIRDDRHILGIISLGKKKRSNEYSDFDLDVLNNLYPYFFVFGYFIKNSLKQSLMGTIDREIELSDQIIQSIQKNMDKITHPNLDVGYISHSTRNLGGDFIDFIRLTESRHMFILGDVSGKGLNASMSMIILKSLMRTFLSETSDFTELIEKVNKFIKFNLPLGTFFAGTFMIIDFHDNVLYYINCGIPGIFLYTESYNNVIEIQGGGKVLGFVKDVSKLLKVRKIKLNPGDIILTCTDGLMDSVSLRGELYGKRRVQTILLENRSYSAEKITQFIHDDLLEFTAKGLQDDISIIALKILDNK